MTQRKTLFLILPMLFVPLFMLSAQQKYALVIGNGAYTTVTRLNNPVNDANDMAATLRNLGFHVDLVVNGDLDQMENAVVRLKNYLSANANTYGFFFYAGHGVQANGENYLIPVNADIKSESFLKSKALQIQIVLDELNQAGNTLNIVVLDACRDNPFSWSRSASRGLHVASGQPADSIIVYATSAGSVAADGTGRNGVFTGELLKHLKTPGLEVKEVFNRTGAGVVQASNRRQTPAVYNQFFGTAYLNGTAVRPTPQPAPSPAPQPVPVQPAVQPERPISAYSIGEEGPGGGIIFSTNNGRYMECSGELGESNWSKANNAAKNYRGGGLNDWRLPTIEELNEIYLNLKKRGLGGFGNGWYLSSSPTSDSFLVKRFSDGYEGYYSNGYPYSVRAVRIFPPQPAPSPAPQPAPVQPTVQPKPRLEGDYNSLHAKGYEYLYERYFWASNKDPANLDKAIEYDSAAYALYPQGNAAFELTQAYTARGIIYYNNGNYALAIADFEKCLSIDPEYANTQEQATAKQYLQLAREKVR